jgi:hypothetical protein
MVKSITRTVGKHMTGSIATTVNVYSGKQADRNRDTYERIWLKSSCEGNGRGVPGNVVITCKSAIPLGF